MADPGMADLTLRCPTCGARADMCFALSHYMSTVARYRAALIICAEIAGADVSDGVPTWPSVDVWAIQNVTQLRKDYDEAPHA